jgi:hypothetical protein
MAKPEMEFFDTELIPWRPVEGRTGQYEKILSMDPETGSHTRLLLSEPDLAACIRDFSHPRGEALRHEDFWEEVYVLRGTGLNIGAGIHYRAGYYACRPPGMVHGPFYHPSGALCLEVRTRR